MKNLGLYNDALDVPRKQDVDAVQSQVDALSEKLVQPDWQQNNETAADYVKNRPGAYDEYDVNITWDGVAGDRLTVPVTDVKAFVKVSDQVLTVDQINGLSIELSSGLKSEITNATGDDFIGGDAVAFISTPGYSDGKCTFPESGIYFGYMSKDASVLFSTSLTSPPTPVKIPQKYLDLDGKLDKNQGAENAGKALVVSDDGNVVPGEAQGSSSITGDDILSSLIDANMMPAVTSAGRVLTDNNGKILLM